MNLSTNNLENVITFVKNQKYPLVINGNGKFCCTYLENPYEFCYQNKTIKFNNELTFTIEYCNTIDELYEFANMILLSGDFHILGFFDDNGNNITKNILEYTSLPNQIIPYGNDEVIIQNDENIIQNDNDQID